MTDRTNQPAGTRDAPHEQNGEHREPVHPGPDGEGGARAERDDGKGVLTAFGRTMKTLRLREGLERPELASRLGYSPATLASFELGRRIPSPATIDRADDVLRADGLLRLWKDQVERAQYPVFFRGMAALEKEAVELLMYDTLVVNGLLQTEQYTRALLGMRRPPLHQDTVEQRLAARVERRDTFDRRTATLSSFVVDESVLRRQYGGRAILGEQLQHLLSVGSRRSVEIQVIPFGCEECAGVDGPFTVVTRRDGKRFVYTEAQGTSTLQTSPEQAALAHARYGIIRSQALSPRESLKFIEGVLSSL